MKLGRNSARLNWCRHVAVCLDAPTCRLEDYKLGGAGLLKKIILQALNAGMKFSMVKVCWLWGRTQQLGDIQRV